MRRRRKRRIEDEEEEDEAAMTIGRLISLGVADRHRQITNSTASQQYLWYSTLWQCFAKALGRRDSIVLGQILRMGVQLRLALACTPGHFAANFSRFERWDHLQPPVSSSHGVPKPPNQIMALALTKRGRPRWDTRTSSKRNYFRKATSRSRIKKKLQLVQPNASTNRRQSITWR